MDRNSEVHLDSWLSATGRKPLVLRGARQVGKTWLVRDLAVRHGLQLIDKKLRFALRLDGNPPSQFDLPTHTTQGDEVTYRLRCLPWYLAGLNPDLLAD